ncbi:MAG: anthranilate phosphoribosyltransferase, partial [Deltaproteobacteria bacterium]|nr:anthranilate phosphoribosyltransferase [Deltaproteobacteria bacterium]
MIQDAIARVVEGRDLSETEMMQVMEEITEGEASPAQIGAFLIGLRAKGESVDEIAAAARVVRSKTAPIPIGQSDVCLDRDEINVDRETVIDTCAFGEDCTRTFNVSTTTAFVVAAAGLRVAKFGYRYASSRWGSADVLEALGLPLDLTPRQVGECLDEVGIGFLYLPYLQGFMRHVAGIRREIGLRTIFNHLGPLSNPAGAKVQVVGVYREDHTELLAQVLKKLDCRRGLAVYGQDSFDELSITGPSRVTSLVDGAIETTVLSPEDLDLPRAEPEEIRGGNASQNAAITRTVLQGEMGARRNLVLLNAAAVLLAAGKVPAWKDGLG